jgi:hypothetical protein
VTLRPRNGTIATPPFGTDPAFSTGMQYITYSDTWRTFPRRETHAIRAEVTTPAADDEHAFASGVVVGIPISLVLWAIIVGVGLMLR